MNLVLFDIDGTLTRTIAVDADCVVAALAEVAGFNAVSTDWAGYEHSTDSGILNEVYQSRLGRPPTHEETAAVRARFVQLLHEAMAASPGLFAAVPGAHDFIEYLLALGYAVALASGGWEESARLKLTNAGLRLEKMPAAFADDALSRRDILLRSRQRACEAYGVAGFDKVAYIGDGSWDARASQSLGYEFIGIESGDQALALTELGAVAVLTDYSDRNSARAALDQAALAHFHREPE